MGEKIHDWEGSDVGYSYLKQTKKAKNSRISYCENCDSKRINLKGHKLNQRTFFKIRHECEQTTKSKYYLRNHDDYLEAEEDLELEMNTNTLHKVLDSGPVDHAPDWGKNGTVINPFEMDTNTKLNTPEIVFSYLKQNYKSFQTESEVNTHHRKIHKITILCGCEQCEYEHKNKHYLRSHQRLLLNFNTHVEEGALDQEKNDAFNDIIEHFKYFTSSETKIKNLLTFLMIFMDWMSHFYMTSQRDAFAEEKNEDLHSYDDDHLTLTEILQRRLLSLNLKNFIFLFDYNTFIFNYLFTRQNWTGIKFNKNLQIENLIRQGLELKVLTMGATTAIVLATTTSTADCLGQDGCQIAIIGLNKPDVPEAEQQTMDQTLLI